MKVLPEKGGVSSKLDNILAGGLDLFMFFFSSPVKFSSGRCFTGSGEMGPVRCSGEQMGEF